MKDEYSRRKVFQEVYILKKIRHSNIIRYNGILMNLGYLKYLKPHNILWWSWNMLVAVICLDWSRKGEDWLNKNQGSIYDRYENRFKKI